MIIEKEINELESLIEQSTKSNPEISARGVDWHIDHSLRSINIMSNELINSNPDEFKWKFNKMRFVIFGMGSIPRGKGRAPEVAQAKGEITKEALHKQLVRAKERLIEIENLPPKSYFNHPSFGMMNLDMTKKLFKIHTCHHLKIIRDIISK
jgi:hypothetical protein